MQLAEPHAKVSAQRRFFGIACVQYLQVIPSQLQAKLDGPRILFGAARTTRCRVAPMDTRLMICTACLSTDTSGCIALTSAAPGFHRSDQCREHFGALTDDR